MAKSREEAVIELLEEPGEVNHALEGQFEKNGSGYDILFSQLEPCQLCKIYRPPFSWTDSIIEEMGDFYLAECVTKKGHETRNMAVLKQHGNIPGEKLKQEMKDRLIERSTERMTGETGVVYGSMNSIPDHYHIVFTDTESSDLERINSYELYSVAENYELTERNICDELGEIVL